MEMQLTNFKCNCGNELTIPQIVLIAGLLDNCGHCGAKFARENHEAVLTTYASAFTEEELLEMGREKSEGHYPGY